MKFKPFYVKTENLNLSGLANLREIAQNNGANLFSTGFEEDLRYTYVGVDYVNDFIACDDPNLFSADVYIDEAIELTYEEALLHVQGESISLKLEEDTNEDLPIDIDFSISFIDCHGVACSVQNSSSVQEDRIWLGIDNPKPMILHSRIKEGGTGWVEYPLPEDIFLCGRMHLNVKQVKRLLPALENFVKTGNIYDKGDK